MGTTYKTFSQRYGYEEMKDIQRDELDETTRRELWNAIYSMLKWSHDFAADMDRLFYTDYLELYRDDYDTYNEDKECYVPKDKTPLTNEEVTAINYCIKDKLNRPPAILKVALLGYNSSNDTTLSVSWEPMNKLFDLLELTLQSMKNTIYSFYDDTDLADEELHAVVYSINEVLRNNRSIYRLPRDTLRFMKFSNDTELESINRAMNTSHKNVNDEFEEAVQFYISKKYTQSVHHSIKAIEGIIKVVVNDPKATFHTALKKIRNNNILKIHPAIQESFNHFCDGSDKLYGYTGDTSKHTQIDEEKYPEEEEALFCLVTSSAIINYFISKDIKAKATEKAEADKKDDIDQDILF